MKTRMAITGPSARHHASGVPMAEKYEPTNTNERMGRGRMRQGLRFHRRRNSLRTFGEGRRPLRASASGSIPSNSAIGKAYTMVAQEIQ